MRPLRALLIYLLAVFVGGALLAPWLYWLAQQFAGSLPGLAHQPFHRFVDRSLLGVALIGLWPLLRGLAVRSWRDIGITNPSGQWSRLGGGFLLGFASLAAVAVIALLSGGRVIAGDLTPARFARQMLTATGTAIVVAVLEEILFRGAVFGSLRKAWDWCAAAIVSAMVYAIAHFFARAELAGSVDWLSGLELLPRMLAGFGDIHAILPGFFSLTVAGLLLAVAYQRTGNLYFSIGLHAGWIFWLRFYNVLCAPAPGANTVFWGSSKITDGWLALALLAAAAAGLPRSRAASTASMA